MHLCSPHTCHMKHWLHTRQKSKELTLDLRLPPRLNWILPSSGLLRGVSWSETDVSRLPIGPIFKGPLLEDGTIDSPETSVSNHLTPRNNPEDERIHKNNLILCYNFHQFLKNITNWRNVLPTQFQPHVIQHHSLSLHSPWQPITLYITQQKLQPTRKRKVRTYFT
jgi:hypothetical protein